MPKWHEDARSMREAGMTAGQIVKQLAGAGIVVSETRVYQVTGPQWQKYLLRERRQVTMKPSEATMPDRQFEKASSPDPSDVYHRVRIRCSHDGCKESLIFSRRGPINPVQAAKWYRDKGWAVGGGPRADLCPIHFGNLGKQPLEQPLEQPPHPEALDPEALEGPHPEVLEGPESQPDAGIVMVHENITEQPPASVNAVPVLPEPQPAVQPDQSQKTDPVEEQQAKAMSRTDRRIVISKLNDVYVDEFTGYRGEWTDRRVAEDLGIPVDWVVLIRDENFGPARNEAELVKLAALIKASGDRLEREIAGISTAIKEYDKLAERLDTRLDLFEKSAAEMRAMIIQHRKANQ